MDEPRPRCDTCHAPRVACVCDHVTPQAVGLGLLIVQHPKEARRTINTARLIPLVIPEAQLVIHGGPAVSPPPGSWLLFPGKDAVATSTLPSEPPPTIVVVDGTWRQARGMVNRDPALSALPRVAISPGEPSRYQIRKQPDVGFLCTLEAVAALLAERGEAPAATALLRPFDALVRFQLACSERAQPRWRKRAQSGSSA